MSDTTRRRLGFIYGLILGLAYSLVASFINQWALPGLPLYAPWPGAPGLVVLGALMFAALGLAAAWSEEPIPGVIASAACGSLLSSIWAWQTQPGQKALALILLFYLFLPRVVFYLPFGAAVRWLISRSERALTAATPLYQRAAPALLMVLLAAGLGTFSLHGEEVRTALRVTDDMVQKGVKASTLADVPGPLKGLDDFINRANGEYTLAVSLDTDILPVQRPVAAYGVTESLIIVRFENGYMFGCVFTPPSSVPVCGNFSAAVR